MSLESMMGEDGQFKPEVMEQGLKLVREVAELCGGHDPALVLFVLEAALTEQIEMFAPPLGDLFRSSMRAYKNKAAMLLTVATLLKDSGLSIEEILQAEAEQTTEKPLRDTL